MNPHDLTDAMLETHIELASKQQGLIIDPAWRESVITYYRLATRMATMLEAHSLSPIDEPAPMFSA